MRKQLLELYYSILNKGYAPDSCCAKQLSRVVELEDALKAALPRSFQSDFDAYTDAVMKLSEMSSEEAFIAGYQTGVRLMMCALLDMPD